MHAHLGGRYLSVGAAFLTAPRSASALADATPHENPARGPVGDQRPPRADRPIAREKGDFSGAIPTRAVVPISGYLLPYIGIAS